MARVVGKSALWKSLFPREQVYCHRFKCFCCIHRRFVIHVASFHTLVSLLLFFTNFSQGENTRKWLHVRGVPKKR